MYKIGIIGCGNMAEAIASGIVMSKLYQPKEVLMSDIDIQKREKLNKELEVKVTGDNSELIRNSEVVLLAVKPQVFEKALNSQTASLLEGKLLISIMGGITLERLSKAVPVSCVIARVMPNTPALVQAGMSSVCFAASAGEQDKEKVKEILSCIGEYRELEEHLFEASTAVAGCSPAFVFMMIEAMADSAVSMGLSREAAYQMAAKAVQGSAELCLATGEHPGILKDMVCSPGGITIEGVKTLEKDGFRYSLMDAMQACADKSAELGKKNA